MPFNRREKKLLSIFVTTPTNDALPHEIGQKTDSITEIGHGKSNINSYGPCLEMSTDIDILH